MISIDYSEIQEQFNKIISYSQNIPQPHTTALFNKWQSAKYRFIQLFGNSLIWEYPEEVTFELSQKDKKNRFDDFIDMLVNRWQNDSLADFVEAQE